MNDIERQREKSALEKRCRALGLDPERDQLVAERITTLEQQFTEHDEEILGVMDTMLAHFTEGTLTEEVSAELKQTYDDLSEKQTDIGQELQEAYEASEVPTEARLS